MLKNIRRKILLLFRLDNHPVIRVYRGYGNAEKIVIFGHVLKLSPMTRKTYRDNWMVNIFSLLRLFMVKPFVKAKVCMEWEGTFMEVETQDDGFFRFEWNPQAPPVPGWHRLIVSLSEEKYKPLKIEGKGRFLIPYESQHAFISDIDDTFLISHSSKLRKRLYVLFTKNARSRKPFAGVVNHYKQLAKSGHSGDLFNPFFYVSSSEWNLFALIREFARQNGLPDGVYLLNQLKKIGEVLRTGQNKHSGKFTRIVRVIETYPHLRFILLGDDTQEDPNIYLSIAQHFSQNIFAVYIRKVHKHKFTDVKAVIEHIKATGVHCCYFENSFEAIEDSKKIGLIIAEVGRTRD